MYNNTKTAQLSEDKIYIKYIDLLIMNAYNIESQNGSKDFIFKFQSILYEALNLEINKEYQNIKAKAPGVDMMKLDQSLNAQLLVLETLNNTSKTQLDTQTSAMATLDRNIKSLDDDIKKQEGQIKEENQKKETYQLNLETLKADLVTLQKNFKKIPDVNGGTRIYQLVNAFAKKSKIKSPDYDYPKAIKVAIDKIRLKEEKIAASKHKIDTLESENYVKLEQTIPSLNNQKSILNAGYEKQNELNITKINHTEVTIGTLREEIKNQQDNAQVLLDTEKNNKISTMKDSLNGLNDNLEQVYQAIKRRCKIKGLSQLTVDDLEQLKKISVLNKIYNVVIKCCKICGTYQETKTKVELKKDYKSHVDKIIKHMSQQTTVPSALKR